MLSARMLTRTAPTFYVRLTLQLLAVGLIALLATPYTVDAFFNWTHMAIGATVFLCEMVLGAYTGVFSLRTSGTPSTI